MNKKIVFSCGLVVAHYINNIPHILLIQSNSGEDFWQLPKGHVEDNETFEEAAIRETVEETGVLAKIICPLPVVRTEKKNKLKIIPMFLAVPTSNDIVLGGDGEAFDIKFWPIDKLPQIIDYQNKVIEKALSLIYGGILLKINEH